MGDIVQRDALLCVTRQHCKSLKHVETLRASGSVAFKVTAPPVFSTTACSSAQATGVVSGRSARKSAQ